MKKRIISVIVMMLLASFVLLPLAAKDKKEKIAAGSADDPFKNTSWINQQVSFDFLEDGKVDAGVSGTYTVTKQGDVYVANMKVNGAKFTFTLEGKDATEGVQKVGSVKVTFKRK